MPTLGPETAITITPPPAPRVNVKAPAAPTTFVVPTPGPAGPQGAPGSGGAIYTQGSPAATWTINTSLGRKPYFVQVYDDAGNLVQPDVQLPSTSQIVVVFASPATGTVAYS